MPSPAVTNSFLGATAILGPNDIWAVGEASNPSTGRLNPVIEHFNGTSWSVMPSPTFSVCRTADLTGVAAISDHDIWAVGMVNFIGFTSPLIEHFDGSTWSVVSSPALPASGHLNSITALGANNIWAVGTVGTTDLIEHFNGSTWSVVPTPNGAASNADLLSVSGTSASDVWAVGTYGGSKVEVLHYNGTSWSRVAAPSPAADSTLHSVVALAPNNVWAVGSTNVGPRRTLIEHFDGTKWSVVASPNASSGDNVLNSIAAVSANDIWAVGTYTDPTTGLQRTLTEHFDGTKWSRIASPNGLSNGDNVLGGVAATSTGTVVAVGYTTDSSGNTNNLILHS
jgi:hypothetical protein